jgi:hypothetical protein
MRTKEEVLRDWPEIPARAKRVALGYRREDRPDGIYWVPDLETVFYIDEALDQLDAGLSLREVAEWLSQKIAGAPTHAGLAKIRLRMRPDFIRVKPRPKVVHKTMAERAEERRRKKIKSDKHKITNAKKRIEKNQEEIIKIRGVAEEDASPMLISSPDDGYDWDALEETHEENVIFRPHPGPQTEFLAATEREVLYGGSAGGGKSFAMVVDPMRYFGSENFNGILLRRTNDELRELIRSTQLLYPKAFPGAKWSESKKSWTFPSGANFWMTYLERDDDVLRYQGQAFTWIGFDELTQYPTPMPWNYMRGRLRSADKSLIPFLSMRATTNPGGPGHGWVKEMFIDPAPPMVPFPATDERGEIILVPVGDTDFPEEQWGKPLFMRKFIPASLKDNPSLDHNYKANLLSLPEHLRRQLLDGDWSIVAGAAFPEFRSHIHTCEPFDVPDEWRRFRSCDFGYSARSASAVHWYAIDPNNTLWLYRELYVNQLTGQALAQRVLEAEAGEKIAYGVLDSAVWENKGQSGPSIAEEMIRAGCRWRPADKGPGSRVAGKNRIHELLKVDPFTGKPALMIFNNCRKIIAGLQVIPVCPDGTDDIDKKYADDHAYDSLRYGVMTRPRAHDPFSFGKMGGTISTYRPSDSKFGY